MQMNQLLKETSGFHRKPDSSGEEEHGFFSLDSFKHYYLKYIEQGFLTLTGHSVYQPATSSGRLLNLLYCLFALLLTATYTANLATFLLYEETKYDITSIEHLATSGDTVCTPGGTANAAWVKKAFPEMITLEKSSVQGMVEGMNSGECAAFVSPRSIGQYELHNNCAAKVQVVGTPLKYGYTEMAVGVSNSRPEVVETLNYWLLALKQCSTGNKDSVCYNGANMDYLWNKWIETNTCALESEEKSEFHRFSFDDFAAIYGFMWAMGWVALIHALLSNRALIRLRLKKKGKLLEFMKSNYGQYFDQDQLLVDRFMEEVWKEHKSDGEFMHTMIKYTQTYYLRTDVNTWRVLTLTLKRLIKNLGLVSRLNSSKINNEAYVMAIIFKSQETLEVLVRRALNEASESSTMRIMEMEQKQVFKEKDEADLLSLGKRVRLSLLGKSKNEAVHRKSLSKAGPETRPGPVLLQVVNAANGDLEMQPQYSSVLGDGDKEPVQSRETRSGTNFSKFFDLSRIQLGSGGQVEKRMSFTERG